MGEKPFFFLINMRILMLMCAQRQQEQLQPWSATLMGLYEFIFFFSAAAGTMSKNQMLRNLGLHGNPIHRQQCWHTRAASCTSGGGIRNH